MQVKEAMCTHFKVIRPETTLREAAQIMRDCECGYLPVGQNDRLTGAITDRDIIVRGLAAGHTPDETVDTVMTQKIVYIFENDDVKDAAAKMKEEKIRRLTVLNSDKRMTGVITLGDIARACNDNELAGDVEVCIAQAA